MNNRIFAIGDVHGHLNTFIALLQKLTKEAHYNPKEDHLVLLGDLVDGGWQTKGVLDWAMQYQEAWSKTFHPIKGNHEDMLLDALHYNNTMYGDYYLWWNQGGQATLKSYTDALHASDYEKAIMQPLDFIPEKHIEWLDTLPYYWESEQYFFVHGGVLPDVLLKDHHFHDLETRMKMLWIREPFILSQFQWEKKIIFAHTPHKNSKGQFVPIVMPNKIGLNTLPRNSGYLTAVELPTEKFYFQQLV